MQPPIKLDITAAANGLFDNIQMQGHKTIDDSCHLPR
jgi:hypothetical protein